MYETWRNQAQLKANAGLSARGRKNDKPVLHYTLAWHVDDKPSPDQMRAAAIASLRVLGLQEHEALIVAHDDKKHPHVHIVANTVHPYTGRTAELKFSKERLSEWAEAYEREHGRIRCEERVRNNEERREIRERRREESRATTLLAAAGKAAPETAPYVPVKDRSPNRPQWLEKQVVIDRMKRLRAELDLQHKVERGVTWERQRRERDALDRDTEAANDNARNHVRDTFRPRWRDLYAAQGREKRLVDNTTLHPLERAVFVLSNRKRLGHDLPLGLRQMIGMVLSTKRLTKALDRVHLRERRNLGREEKTLSKQLTERIWGIHRERFHTLRDRQAVERDAERGHQRLETKDITFARAKEHLIHEAEHPPAYRPAPKPRREGPEPVQEFNEAAAGPAEMPLSRAEQIRRDMEIWRRHNDSRDFGREL